MLQFISMPQKTSTLAIAAFIFSLIFFIPTFSIIGLIAGIAAFVHIQKNPKLKGKGLAIAAIIIGLLVTALQIILFFSVYSLFSGFANSIDSKNPKQSIDKCIKSKSSFGKDFCIILVLAANINNTEGIDKNICDAQIGNLEMKNYCNAVLKKDKEYCYKISNSDSRIKCLGLIDELNRKVNKQSG